MDTDRYLNRIGLSPPEEPDLDSLANLQLHHLLAIPFENLSIAWGQPVLLEEKSLYEKIILSGRGGFCYELNGLLAWLLEQLGFKVSRCSARVYTAETGQYGQEFDHITLLVDLGEKYLVDAGFGDSFRMPLRMPNGEIEDASGKYRVLPAGDDNYRLEQLSPNGWMPQYRFTTRPCELQDFNDMCRYHQTSPASSFTWGPVCTRATPQGRITLTRKSLTITENGVKEHSTVTSEEDFRRLLASYYGIHHPGYAKSILEDIVR